MTHYTAEVLWLRDEQDFLDNRYSRKHVLHFDGGLDVPGSSSSHVVSLPMSDATAMDRGCVKTPESMNCNFVPQHN